MLPTYTGEDPTLAGCSPVVTYVLTKQMFAVDIKEGCDLEHCSVDLKPRKYADNE